MSVSDLILQLLSPWCVQVEVVGSLRRGEDSRHDIDVLAIPHIETRTVPTALFAPGGAVLPVQTTAINHLWRALDDLILRGTGPLWRHPPLALANGQARQAAWGDRHRKLLWRSSDSDQPISVDLYTTDDASWGAQQVIRTGPSDFSRRWVTELRDFGLRMVDGQVVSLRNGQRVPCRTEREAFALAGWRYRRPEMR